MADSLYQVLSEIQVSKEDVIEAETFSKQYLQSLYPNLDLREGVALHDLVLRPFSVLVAMLNKGMAYYFANNTLSGVTDESPEDIVDKLLSNFFLVRNQGSSSAVRARLYFLTNNRDIYLSQSVTFSQDNITFFKPLVETFIRGDSLTRDPERDEYYYDLDLQSTTQDASANVESGEFIYFSNFDPYFISASVLYLVEKAVSKETNVEFVSRATTAVSTRNLINDISIDSTIKETFNYITDVVPVGYGDSEMARDLILVQNPVVLTETEELHAGGKVDVYINSEVDERVEAFVTDSSGRLYISGENIGGSLIAYKVQRASSTATNQVPNDRLYTVTVGGYDEYGVFRAYPTLDYGFSPRQVVQITFSGTSVANKNVSFRIFRFTDVKTVNDFISNDVTRVICADQLAVALDRLEVNVNIKKVGSGLETILSQSEIDSAVSSLGVYFKAVRSGQSLVVADLLDVLRNEAGISGINSALSVTVKRYTKNSVFKLQDEIVTNVNNAADTPLITVSNGFLACNRTQRFVLGTVTSN